MSADTLNRSSLALLTRSLSTERTAHRTSRSDHAVNLAVLGHSGVGKSALMVRFITRRFIGDYAHHESMCTWDATIDGKPAKMHLLDTTAQEPCETRPTDKMKWADGFLVVFSVTDRSSFESARTLINHMQRLSAGRRPAAVLVGNKSDLRHFRVVTETEARDVAAVLGCPYVETSASEDYEGVAEAFKMLFTEARAAVKRDKIHSLLNRCPLSTISHIRDTLKSMTDSRARTNTF